MTTPILSSLPVGQNALALIQQMLAPYGLQALAHHILQWGRAGNTAEEINYLLQGTKAYQRRFAGNEERLKNGLPPLSPAEYIATEAQHPSVVVNRVENTASAHRFCPLNTGSRDAIANEQHRHVVGRSPAAIQLQFATQGFHRDGPVAHNLKQAGLLLGQRPITHQFHHTV